MLHRSGFHPACPAPAARVLGLVGVILLSACADSDADRKKIRTGLNRAPSVSLRVAGRRQVGADLMLDGRESSDPDGDHLEPVWSLDQKPRASALFSSSFIEARPMLAKVVPDLPGAYKLRLTVSDGELLATGAALVMVEPSIAGGDDGGDDDPTVSLICPSRGALAGGDLVRIVGGFFPEGTRVFFGDRLGLEVTILEEGSIIEVRTPPGVGLGLVDVTIELDGRKVEAPAAFRYLPGPLAFDPDRARDASLDRSPSALAALGDRGVLLGLGSGAVRLATFAGGVPTFGPALATGAIGRVVRLHPPARRPGGDVAVGGATVGGSSPFVVRVAADGALSASVLDFEGEAIDVEVVDIGPAGGATVFVADRSGQRVVAYAGVATSGGQSYAPVAEHVIAGSPCALAAAQLDDDPELELVVGCYPGPELSVLDEKDGAVTARSYELDDMDGIALLAAGDFTGDGRDGLAAVALDGGTADPEHGPRSVRFIFSVPGGGGLAVLERPRVALRTGGNGLEASDLDRDGDVDLTAFSGASGEALVLENLRNDGPETAAECAAILESGDRRIASAFDVRLLRVPMFDAAGILALVPADLDGDGFPDLLGSHSKEVAGLRGVPNATGE